MKKLANHTALKEWAEAIAALGRGEQVVLIRKGGIADPDFGVEAERFYLFPTYFHQPEKPADPRIHVTHWAEVVRTWRVHELAILERLAPHVVFPRDTLLDRYRFRPDQALHILGVRTYALETPVTIEPKDEYGGCRSWISIDDEIDVDGSQPVLAEPELAAKLDEIAALLEPASALR